MKIAVLNLNTILEKSKRAKELTAELQDASKGWQNKHQAASEARDKLLARLQSAGAAQMKPQDMQRAERDLQGLELELTYLRQRAEAELKSQATHSQEVIVQELKPILATYAKEQGLSMVFSLQGAPLLFLDPAIDVTDAVVRLYDARAR